jgi:hypothetical protein
MNLFWILFVIILATIVFSFCCVVYYLERIHTKISEMIGLLENTNERSDDTR